MASSTNQSINGQNSTAISKSDSIIIKKTSMLPMPPSIFEYYKNNSFIVNNEKVDESNQEQNNKMSLVQSPLQKINQHTSSTSTFSKSHTRSDNLQNSSITNIAEKFIELVQEPVNKTPIVQSSEQKTNEHVLFPNMFPMTRTRSGNLKSNVKKTNVDDSIKKPKNKKKVNEHTSSTSKFSMPHKGLNSKFRGFVKCFTCVICNKMFNSKIKLSKHMIYHKMNFKCDDCLQGFQNIISLKNHIYNNHIDANNGKCMICYETFYDTINIPDHFNFVHKIEDPHKCSVCALFFIKLNFKNQHEQICIKEKNESSTRNFPMTSGRSERLKNISNPATIENVNKFIQELQNTKPVVQAPIVTSIQPILSRSLNSDMNSHNVEKSSFLCEICGKHIFDYTQFLNHKTYHIIKNFKCNICVSGFELIFMAGRHIFTHMDIDLLKCMICLKRFNNINNMFNHILHTHKVENPYECEKCNKFFVCKQNLRQHMVVHMKKTLRGTYTIKKSMFQMRDERSDYLKNTIIEEKDIAYMQAPVNQLNQSPILQPLLKINNQYAPSSNKLQISNNLKENPSIIENEKVFEYFLEPVNENILIQSPTVPRPQLQLTKNNSPLPDIVTLSHRILNSKAKSPSVEKSSFICEFCGKSFFDKMKLSWHKSFHGSTHAKCLLCKQIFDSIMSLNRHFCDQTFVSKYSSRNHNVQVRKIKKPTCNKSQLKIVNPNSSLFKLPDKRSDKLKNITSTITREKLVESIKQPDNRIPLVQSTIVQSPLQNIIQHSPFTSILPMPYNSFDNTNTVSKEVDESSNKTSLESIQSIDIDNFIGNEIVKYEVDEIDGNIYTSCITIVKDETTKLIENMYSQNSPGICELCHKLFSDSIKLKNHMTYHIRRGFKCKKCKNGFKHIFILNRHVISHHMDINNSKCKICLKKCVDNISLWNHIIHVHKAVEPYKCSRCLKYFSNKRYLRQHVISHMKRKLCGACIICNIHPSNLLSGNGKLTNCLFCDKKFAILKNLRKHMGREHKFKSPYKCDMCFTIFSDISHFITHVINYTKKNIYCTRYNNN